MVKSPSSNEAALRDSTHFKVRDQKGESPVFDPDSSGQSDDDGSARAVRMLTLSAAKWSLPVLEALEEGVVRFNALQRHVRGIRHRLLAMTLQRFVEDGLVERIEYDEAVLHVEYHLTEAGRDFLATAHGFCKWSASYPPTVLQDLKDPPPR